MPVKRLLPPLTGDQDARWHAVKTRDPRAEGLFVYGVTTTGIYCRPTCTAKLPKPANVRFFASPRLAQQAGFRGCKRCRPEVSPKTENAQRVAEWCRLLEASDGIITLGVLAKKAKLSPSHFQRSFKAATGLSPRAYAAAQRTLRLREALPKSGSVTDAMFEVGYGSSGRFYETAGAALGMPPQVYLKGGPGRDIQFATFPCAFGLALVAATAIGVCAIFLGENADAMEADLRRRFPKARLVPGDAAYRKRVAEVIQAIDGKRGSSDLPLDIAGTVFQERVWQALLKIPPGSTTSYGALAASVGAPKSYRAVAQACGANPVAVLIPCHRVVKNDGGISGYRWGVERKRKLLAREARAIRKGSVKR